VVVAWVVARRTSKVGRRKSSRKSGGNVRVRTVRVRSKRTWTAVERAYTQKYVTPASLAYVRGFRTPRRREATIEFLPR